MFEKRQIIIQLRNGVSIRKVSRDVGVHRPIVRELYRIAALKGWLNPDSEMPSDKEIADCIESASRSSHKLDIYFDKIKQWKLEGMTSVVIQRLLKEQYACPCGISALRRYVKRTCSVPPDPVMIRSTVPAEHMDVGGLWISWLSLG